MLEMRPRSATEIIDAAFQLLRANYVPLVTLAAAAQIPLVVINIAMARMGFAEWVTAASKGKAAVTPFEGASAGGIFLGAIATIVVVMVTQAALTSAASEAYLGRVPSPGAAFGRGLSRFLTMLGALFILLLMYFGFGIAFAIVIPIFARLGLGSMLGVVVAIVFLVALFYYAIRLALLYPVIVVEPYGSWGSLKRIWALGEGSFWHMFFTLLIVLVIAVVAYLIVFGLSLALGSVLRPVIGDIGLSIVLGVVFALVLPFFPAAVVALYYDQRIRKDGLDVEMMASSMGG